MARLPLVHPFALSKDLNGGLCVYVCVLRACVVECGVQNTFKVQISFQKEILDELVQSKSQDTKHHNTRTHATKNTKESTPQVDFQALR